MGPPLLLLCVAACSGSHGIGDGGDLDGGTVALDGSRDATVPPGACTGDERLTRSVYYGTPEPTALPLSHGQVLAVVNFGGCSGTFITDEWILTADHCGITAGREACVGEDPRNADVCFRVVEAVSHPDADATLVRVATPASTRIPQLIPIPIMTELVDDTWIGRIAEAAGYGTQEDGSSDEREFTAEPIDGFEGPFVVINGMGERGVCFGDSGGPVMVLASDSTVRVLGDLSYGDPSCVGRDRYTRVDRIADWVEGFTGPTVVEGAPCGRITPIGECSGATAVWCDGEALTSERCEAGTTCGWDTASNGYRCITGADPCEGVTAIGECQGQAAVWCDRGTLRRRDCGSCGEVCFNIEEVGGYYCGADPCDGIDYLGECRGDTAVWCDEGTINMRDCAARGLHCGYVNDRIGNFCTR